MARFIAPLVAFCIVIAGIIGFMTWLEGAKIQAEERHLVKWITLRETHVKKVDAGARLVSLPKSGLCGVLSDRLDLLPCDMAVEVSLITGVVIKPLYQ